MKIQATALVCVMATTALFSSCLNDDEGSVSYLSSQDSITANTIITGDYTGKITYQKPNYVTEDTVTNIVWHITALTSKRSKMVMDNFPVSIFADFISASEKNHIYALEEADDQSLTFSIVPMLKISSSSGTIYEYSLSPSDLTFTATYNDVAYTVTISFSSTIADTSGNYYYPVAFVQNDVFEANILIKSITIGDTEYETVTVLGLRKDR